MYPDIDQIIQGAHTVFLMTKDCSITLYSMSSSATITVYSLSSSATITVYSWLGRATEELYRTPCVEDNISYPWFIAGNILY